MSVPIRTSAPGKLVVAGEYAVLEGHPAMATAVRTLKMVSPSCALMIPSCPLEQPRDPIRARLGVERPVRAPFPFDFDKLNCFVLSKCAAADTKEKMRARSQRSPV